MNYKKDIESFNVDLSKAFRKAGGMANLDLEQFIKLWTAIEKEYELTGKIEKQEKVK